MHVAPLEGLVRRCTSCNQVEMIGQKRVDDHADEQGKQEERHNWNGCVHQVLENVTVRRLLNHALHISVVPQSFSLHDSQQDERAQIRYVVDDHTSEQQEQQEPPQIQQTNAVVNPRTVMVMSRRITT